jgi:hypothetical protein
VRRWARKPPRPCPTRVLGPLARLLLLILLASSGAPAATAQAASALPDVEIVLVVEIDDTTNWLVLHDAVLGTASESLRPLAVHVASSTGGRRTITVHQHRLDAQIYVSPGMNSVRVLVTGKIQGAEAVRNLTPFQAAVFAIQAGAMENELTLVYGLAAVRAQLLELHLGRP